jgi:hypothetical protein
LIPFFPIYRYTPPVFTLFTSSSSSQFAPVPFESPPPLPSSSSLPVRGSGWPRCLPQALRAPTLIRSLPYTRVPNSLTWLLPQFVHSAASRHARFTVRVLGHWTVPSYLSDIPSDRRRNHHLLHLLPVALARSLAGSSIIDLDCLLCVYHTSAVLV